MYDRSKFIGQLGRLAKRPNDPCQNLLDLVIPGVNETVPHYWLRRFTSRLAASKAEIGRTVGWQQTLSTQTLNTTVRFKFTHRHGRIYKGKFLGSTSPNKCIPSMGSSPVGVQCTFNYYFPCLSVLCLPFPDITLF